MLQKKPVKPAHHHDRVKRHQQRRHRTPETEAAVQQNQRHRQEREPDVGTHPALHMAETQPRRRPLSRAEQRREDENAERDRAEDQAKRSAADRRPFARLLAKNAQRRRDPLRVKLCHVKHRGRGCREKHK